jgi:hypothetical protein
MGAGPSARFQNTKITPGIILDASRHPFECVLLLWSPLLCGELNLGVGFIMHGVGGSQARPWWWWL